MKLEDILIQDKLNLPYLFAVKEKLSIYELKRILVEYKQAIVETTDLFSGIFKESDPTVSYIYDANKFTNSVLHITKGIINSLDYYLDGSPSDSYNHIAQTINDDPDFKRILSAKISQIDAGSIFYRLRTDDDKNFEFPLTFQQLFHVPFQKRFMISPQRFSISGYPSLYMSGSLLTACSEMDVCDAHTNLEKVKVSAFKNLRKIKYVDLAAKDIKELLAGHTSLKIATSDDKLRQDIYDYGIMFPLIAACHTKISYDEPYPRFKVEYVIPQIILQWSKINNHLVDGIKYFCNRITPANKHNHEDVYNYVFPVRKSADEGYCHELSTIFSATPVVEVKKIKFAGSDFNAQIKELQELLTKMPFNTFQ